MVVPSEAAFGTETDSDLHSEGQAWLIGTSGVWSHFDLGELGRNSHRSRHKQPNDLGNSDIWGVLRHTRHKRSQCAWSYDNGHLQDSYLDTSSSTSAAPARGISSYHICRSRRTVDGVNSPSARSAIDHVVEICAESMRTSINVYTRVYWYRWCW